MVYIAVLLVIALGILRSLTPKLYAVHASTAGELPDGIMPQGHYLLAGLVRDPDGKAIDLDGKFVGRATRDSMTSYGIAAGATFIADYVDDGARASLRHGDIVVVDGVAKKSETGLRLRCVDKVDHENVVFLKDSNRRLPRQRPLHEVVARVTYVIDRPSATSFFSRLLGRVAPGRVNAA